MFDIDPETLKKAAQAKWKESVELSAPYWVDHEIVRVMVLSSHGYSFGANFYYKEGIFK